MEILTKMKTHDELVDLLDSIIIIIFSSKLIYIIINFIKIISELG